MVWSLNSVPQIPFQVTIARSRLWGCPERTFESHHLAGKAVKGPACCYFICFEQTSRYSMSQPQCLQSCVQVGWWLAVKTSCAGQLQWQWRALARQIYSMAFEVSMWFGFLECMLHLRTVNTPSVPQIRPTRFMCQTHILCVAKLLGACLGHTLHLCARLNT